MNECPCCNDRLLRCVAHNRVYWYCRHCHEKMPDLDKVLSSRRQLDLLVYPQQSSAESLIFSA